MIYKPTKEDLLAAKNKTLPDIIDYNLKVLFCGINPGLYTAAVGHHFGRPGNRFWKTLFEAGFTDRLLHPSEQELFLKKGYGITNLVERATNLASEIGNHEFTEGGKRLIHKIEEYKPKWLAFVGIGAYKIAFNQPHAITGKQDIVIANANVWLLPSTSGLNANYRPMELVQLFKNLRLTLEKEKL